MTHTKIASLLLLVTTIGWGDSHVSFSPLPSGDQSNLFSRPFFSGPQIVFDGTVFGESIPIAFATAIGDGPGFACVYCTLDFSPGAYLGATGTTLSFGPGGFINLSGGVDLMGGGNPWDEGNINDTDLNTGLQNQLVGGRFTGMPTIGLLSQGLGAGDDSVFRFSGLFDATLNEQLAQYFGFATDVLHAGMVYFDFTSPWTVAPGDPFQADLIMGGNLTIQNLSPVPELSSLVLLALATAGVGVAVRLNRGVVARREA